MRSCRSPPAGVPDVDMVRSGFTSSLTCWLPDGSGRFGCFGPFDGKSLLVSALLASWRAYGVSCSLGGGPGGASCVACGLSSQLRCRRLATMAAWAAWWLALTIYGGEEGVCFRGENPVWLGQANGGDACGHRHLPKVSIVVTHFPFVVLQMKI